MASETWSSVFGCVSLAFWVVVYSPQLWENYTLQSGEGVSVLFVLIWLLGDVCSLAGALIAQLVPTAQVLFAYYVCCDSLLLFQIYYYRWKKRHTSQATARDIEPVEDTPLLGSAVDPERTSCWSMENEVLKYSLYLIFVVASGILAWTIDMKIHGPRQPSEPEGIIEWRSQILGWVGSAMFLGARIPQILKNVETKCEGLSPALFLFSISGNSTYAISIFFASTKARYLLANAPWLAGAISTVFFDLFLLGQFVHYRPGRKRRIQL